MNKERFLKIYVNVSILLGLIVLITMVAYVLSFPKEYFGLIESSLFNVKLESFTGDVNIFNTPLIIFGTLAILNILMVIRLGDLSNLENQTLEGVAIFNTLFSIMLVAGQVVFYLLIPERVTGSIVDKFIFVEFQTLSDVFVKVFNFNYIIGLVYIGYNIYVAFKMVPDKEDEEEITLEPVNQVPEVEVVNEVEENE